VLDHPYFHGLDDTEAHLNWTRLEALMDEVCASMTGRPSYSLPALFRSNILNDMLKAMQAKLKADRHNIWSADAWKQRKRCRCSARNTRKNTRRWRND